MSTQPQDDVEATDAELKPFDIFFSREPVEGFDLEFGRTNPLDDIPLTTATLSLPAIGVKLSVKGIFSNYFYSGAITIPTTQIKPKLEAFYDVDTFTGWFVSSYQSFSEAPTVQRDWRYDTRDAIVVSDRKDTLYEESVVVKTTNDQYFEEGYVVSSYKLQWFQDAIGVKEYYRMKTQEAVRVVRQLSSKFENAVPLSRTWGGSFQLALMTNNQYDVRANEAVPFSIRLGFSTNLMVQVNTSFTTFYQNAEAIPHSYRAKPLPPLPPPPYVPDTKHDLIFHCPLTAEDKDEFNVDIIFNKKCGQLGNDYVDYTEPYFVINSMTLINVETGEAIQATNVDFGTDRDSFAWSGSLTVGESEILKLESPTNSPVLVALTFNGNDALFMVQNITRSITFNQRSYKVSLMSPTVLLDSPYSPVGSATLTENLAPQTIIEELLDTLNSGIVLNWQYLSALEWIVKAKTFSYQAMSPIKAIGELLRGSATFLYSELDSKTLTVKMKRPYAFWEPATDFTTLDSNILTSYSFSRKQHQNYTGVYAVSGVAGVPALTAFVVRTGTNGADLAPQVVAPSLTSNLALIDAGKYALGTAGIIEERSFITPIIEGNPLLKPADVVKLTYEAQTYVGTVTSTNVSLKFNNQVQTFTVEVVKGFA